MLWLVMTIRETTFQLELHFNITNYQTGELAVFFNVQRSTTEYWMQINVEKTDIRKIHSGQFFDRFLISKKCV